MIIQMPVFRCRMWSHLCSGTTFSSHVWSESFSSFVHSRGRRSKSKVTAQKSKQATGSVSAVQSTSTRRVRSARDVSIQVAEKPRHESPHIPAKASATTKSKLSCLTSVQVCEEQKETIVGDNSKQLTKYFVMDMETTGFCKEKGRIIEIAFRDLSGGENSCFHTLVNPQKNVTNSSVHGITTDMVNHPDVPRMVSDSLLHYWGTKTEDLIPILVSYIGSRVTHEGLALFVAHNGFRFGFPFLFKAFSLCSLDVPANWLFLDTLPLARELIKSKAAAGHKVLSGTSLQALCEYYELEREGPNQRAMRRDVDLLASILQRLTFDLKLTHGNLLERASTSRALEVAKLKNAVKRMLQEGPGLGGLN